MTTTPKTAAPKTAAPKTAAPKAAVPKAPVKPAPVLTMAAVTKLLKRRQIQAAPGDYDLYDALLAMHGALAAMHEKLEQVERIANSLEVKLQKFGRQGRG